MIRGTAVPIRQEMHFIKAAGRKKALKKAQELVGQKEKYDIDVCGRWHIDAVKKLK